MSFGKWWNLNERCNYVLSVQLWKQSHSLAHCITDAFYQPGALDDEWENGWNVSRHSAASVGSQQPNDCVQLIENARNFHLKADQLTRLTSDSHNTNIQLIGFSHTADNRLRCVQEENWYNLVRACSLWSANRFPRNWQQQQQQQQRINKQKTVTSYVR